MRKIAELKSVGRIKGKDNVEKKSENTIYSSASKLKFTKKIFNVNLNR